MQISLCCGTQIVNVPGLICILHELPTPSVLPLVLAASNHSDIDKAYPVAASIWYLYKAIVSCANTYNRARPADK